MGILEETLAKLERLEAKQQQQDKKIAILEKVVAKNGDRIDSAEAKRISGYADTRTLKKYFTPIKVGEGGDYFWSRVEIETQNANKELTKYQPLTISKEAA